jgi:hypothetical protein
MRVANMHIKKHIIDDKSCSEVSLKIVAGIDLFLLLVDKLTSKLPEYLSIKNI